MISFQRSYGELSAWLGLGRIRLRAHVSWHCCALPGFRHLLRFDAVLNRQYATIGFELVGLQFDLGAYLYPKGSP